MLLKNLTNDSYSTVRKHIDNKTTLYDFLISYSIDSLQKIKGSEFSLCFPESADMDRKILLAGTVENFVKISIFQKFNSDKFVENNSVLQTQFSFFNEFLSSYSDKFKEVVGESRFENLKQRVEFSVSESFDHFSDGLLDRALFLFQLSRLYKYQEVFWFKDEPFNDEEMEFIKQVSGKAIQVLSDFVSEGDEINCFPIFGVPEELTASPDLVIGDKLFVFVHSFVAKERIDRQISILRACEFLDMESKDKVIKEKYLYSLLDSGLFRVK